jgi:hypothetical protein
MGAGVDHLGGLEELAGFRQAASTGLVVARHRSPGTGQPYPSLTETSTIVRMPRAGLSDWLRRSRRR